MHWLVLGTGETARTFIGRVTPDVTITSNRGLELAPNADFYWVSDPAAIEIFRPLWEAYKGVVICNDDLGRPTTKFPYRDYGVPFHGRTSGICAARFALAYGATQLSFVGHDGYGPEAIRRRPDGSAVYALGTTRAEAINEAMQDALFNIAYAYPDLIATFYGKTRLQVPPLWEHVTE